MKKRNKFLGLLLLLGAVVLILLAFVPDLPFPFLNVPTWKLILGLILLAWILKKVIFGETLRDHLLFFFPLALLYALFFRELNDALGGTLSSSSIWMVIVASLLLSGALSVFLGHRIVSVHVSGKVNTHENRLSANTLYIDASSHENHKIVNELGETEIFFQNTDTSDDHPIELELKNKLGSIIVHVPREWEVVDRLETSLGDKEIRENTVRGVREIRLSGKVRLGNVEVVSP